MPIPKPKNGEKEEDFIDRCMGNKTMQQEYPDNDQRLAVCYSQWKNKEKKQREVSDMEIVKIEKELRFIDPDIAEIRVKREEGQPVKIVGYIAKFNKLSENLGGFREKIEPGFFGDALTNSDVVDLFNHDPNYVLGRESAGTLAVKETKTGLRFECTPPDTQLIRDLVLTPIERGDIKGCSFGFRVKDGGDSWDEDEEGRVVRTLKKNGCKELIDGSQVTFPAYPDTSVALRSFDEWRKDKGPPAGATTNEESDQKAAATRRMKIRRMKLDKLDNFLKLKQ